MGAPDADDGSGASVFDACAQCGASFETGVRYPVTTWRDDEGNVCVVSFCDDECQRAWDGAE